MWSLVDKNPKSQFSFSDEFEVLALDYFRQEPIRAFLDAVVQSGGIFRHGWTLNSLRFATLALLGHSENVFIDETMFGSHFSYSS